MTSSPVAAGAGGCAPGVRLNDKSRLHSPRLRPRSRRRAYVLPARRSASRSRRRETRCRDEGDETGETALGMGHIKPGAVVGDEIHGYSVLHDRPEPDSRVRRFGAELERVGERVLKPDPDPDPPAQAARPWISSSTRRSGWLSGSSATTSLGKALVSICARTNRRRDRRESSNTPSIRLPIRAAPALTRSRS